MVRQKRHYDKRLSLARKMPPLKRTYSGQEYSAKNDRVLDWVKIHIDLVLYLIDLLARIGYIVYDPESGEWRGADYGD